MLKNLDEMAKEADLFAEMHGGVYTCVNKAHRQENRSINRILNRVENQK